MKILFFLQLAKLYKKTRKLILPNRNIDSNNFLQTSISYKQLPRPSIQTNLPHNFFQIMPFPDRMNTTYLFHIGLKIHIKITIKLFLNIETGITTIFNRWIHKIFFIKFLNFTKWTSTNNQIKLRFITAMRETKDVTYKAPFKIKFLFKFQDPALSLPTQSFKIRTLNITPTIWGCNDDGTF